MRVLSFNENTSSDLNYVDLFLRSEGKTLGGLCIRKDDVWVSDEIVNTQLLYKKAEILARLGKFDETKKALIEYRNVQNDLLSKTKKEQHLIEYERAQKFLDIIPETDLPNANAYQVLETKTSDMYTKLTIKGRNDLDTLLHAHKFLGRYLSQTKFTRIKFTDYAVNTYDFTKDIAIPEDITNALKLQRTAHMLLDIIDTSYFLNFDEKISNLKREQLKLKNSDIRPEIDLEQEQKKIAASITKVSSTKTRQKKLLEELCEKGKSQLYIIKEEIGEDIFNAEEKELRKISELFNKKTSYADTKKSIRNNNISQDIHSLTLFPEYLDQKLETYFKNPNFTHSSLQEFENALFRAQDIIRNNKKLKKYENKILSILQIPNSAIQDYQQTKILVDKIQNTLAPYSAKVEIKDKSLNIKIDSISLDDIKFLDTRTPEQGCKYIGIDTEAWKYRGSKLDPKGSGEETVSICLVSDKGDYSLQIFDCGTDELNYDDRSAKVEVLFSNQRMRRRAAQVWKWVIDAESTLNFNGEGYDFAKLSNPFIITSTKDRKSVIKSVGEKFYKSITAAEPFFNCNVDNTGVLYESSTWKDRYAPIGVSCDILTAVSTYIQELLNDRTLTSVSLANDAINYEKINIKEDKLELLKRKPLDFKKAFESYSVLEDSIQKAIDEKDALEGFKTVQYGYVDTVAATELGMTIDQTFEFLEDKLKIQKENLYRSSRNGVSTTFFDRSIAQKLALYRKELFKQTTYKNVNVEKNKQKIIEWASRHAPEFSSNLENDIGIHENATVFFVPYLSASMDFIIDSIGLKDVEEKRRTSQNHIERIIIQKVMDSILTHVLTDIKLVYDKKDQLAFDDVIDGRYFKTVYGYDAKEFKERFEKNIIDFYTKAFTEKSLMYSGVLAAFVQSNAARLLDLGFTPLGTGKLSVLDSDKFIYNIDGYVASTGIGIQSYKKRFITEKYYFEPKLKIEFEHDLTRVLLNDGKDAAAHYAADFAKKTRNILLDKDKYLVSLKPGLALEDFARQYRNTTKFKLQDMANAKLTESLTGIVEEEDDRFIFKKVDSTDTDALLASHPSAKFYLMRLFQQGRKVDHMMQSFFVGTTKGDKRKEKQSLLEKLMRGEIEEEEIKILVE